MNTIVRTVRGIPGVVLEAATKLHPKLKFAIEELDSNGNLTFFELIVKLDSRKLVTCGWFQKPTDAGTILNFGGCAPSLYKRNVFEGRFIGFLVRPLHGNILTGH